MRCSLLSEGITNSVQEPHFVTLESSFRVFSSSTGSLIQFRTGDKDGSVFQPVLYWLCDMFWILILLKDPMMTHTHLKDFSALSRASHVFCTGRKKFDFDLMIPVLNPQLHSGSAGWRSVGVCVMWKLMLLAKQRCKRQRWCSDRTNPRVIQCIKI